MPDNENNNFSHMNNESNPTQMQSKNMNTNDSKTIIEIPQKYYDNLAKEEQAKREKEAILQQQQNVGSTSESSRMMSFVIINAIIIFGLLYIAIYKFKYAIIGIPASIIIFSIVNAKKDKEKSSYPQSVMVGGILVAVITFVISILKEEEMNLWTNYAILSAGIGFLGMMASSIVTKVISDFKNIKALQGIGYILFFIILIGAPLYLSNKYHEEFYKFLFHEQVEIKAETEEEFVLKTIKQRYNIEFTCGTYASKSDAENKILKVGTYDSKIDQRNRRITERICLDSQKNEFQVISKAYNEGGKQYIVVDTYLETLFIDNIKLSLSNEILAETGTKEVDISLYPKENCYFYGDCVNCDEYYEIFEIENDDKHQYSTSTKLNFEKYISGSPLNFINNEDFKYLISITGQFNENVEDYSEMVNKVIDILNSKGYKNNYGYIISIYNETTNAGFETKELIYKVKGETNTEKTFKDPEVQNISANQKNN